MKLDIYVRHMFTRVIVSNGYIDIVQYCVQRDSSQYNRKLHIENIYQKRE